MTFIELQKLLTVEERQGKAASHLRRFHDRAVAIADRGTAKS